MKKLFIFLILGILLVGSIAFFLLKPDQTEDTTIIKLIEGQTNNALIEIKLKTPHYENQDLDAIFNEQDFNEKVLDFNLKSHPSVDYIKQVGVGNKVVMFYDVNSMYGLSQALGEPEFTNMKTGQIIQRDWKYVYWGKEEYENPVYSCSETMTTNGTITNCKQTGTETKTRETWLNYNSRDILKGQMRIGIEVETRYGDYIDGIWVIGGKKIDRHAGWSVFMLLAEDLTKWNNNSNTDPELKKSFDFPSGANVTTSNNTLCGSTDFGFQIKAFYQYIYDDDSQANTSNHTGPASPPLTCSNETYDNPDQSKTVSTVNVWVWQASWNPTYPCSFENDRVYGYNWTGSGLLISLSSPENNTNLTTTNINFSANVSVAGEVGIQNVTIEVFNLTGLVFNETNTSEFEGVYDFLGSFIDGDYDWNVTAYDDTNEVYYSSTRSFSIDTIFPQFQVNYPISVDYRKINETLQLNWSVTDINLDKCWYNYNGTNITLGSCTTEIDNLENITLFTTKKNITFYANDTSGNLNSTLHSWDYKVFQNSITHNEISYESVIEEYLINITANSSLTAANLIYNGTSYTGTQSGNVWSRILTLGSGNIGNNTLYWSFIYGSDIINTSTYYQNISAITFVLCNTTHNIPFLNFSFKDEGDSSVLNASNDLTDVDYWIGSSSEAKSYITSNSTDHYNYTFCFSPPERIVVVDLIFKYSKTGYPLRTFAYADQSLTNTTTEKTLYLLSTTDGIYSSISVIESSGASIQGVTIQIERQFSGVWTLISQDVTGSDGVATFWVNPNFQHRITATKTNYVATQVTITPSQTLYTLTMQRTTAEAEYDSDIPGIKWAAYPQSGTIPSGIRSFNVTVTSSESNLENCKFELVNVTNSSHVLDSVVSITNSSYCFLNIDYNAQENTKFFGRLSLDTTATTGYIIVNADWKWIVIEIDVKGWRTITSFFADLTTLSEFGEGNEAEFSRIVTFFLIATIIFGVFIYFSGVELNSPGITILLIWGITLFASAGGFLTFYSGSSNVNPIIEQYGFFFIFTIYMINYFMTIIRRANE